MVMIKLLKFSTAMNSCSTHARHRQCSLVVYVFTDCYLLY